MKLTDFSSNKLIYTGIPADSKEALFAYISNSLNKSNIIPDIKTADSLRKDLLERENVNSTGLGNGIAIPHVSLPGLKKPLVIICRTEKPLEYNSLDSRPVDLFFFILGRTSHISEHLNILSRLAFLLKDKTFLSRLRTAKKQPEIWELFRDKDLNTP